MLEVNKVYTGDCLEIMKNISNESVDMILTSPPYDNIRNYENTNLWNKNIWEKVIEEFFRIIKEGGVVVWIVGDATIKGSETGTSFKQALYFKEVGFNLHDTMIYQKNGAGAVGSNKCYIQNFEYMFILTKGKIKTTNLIRDRKNKKVCNTITNTNRNKNNADTKRKYRNISTKEFGKRFNVWTIEQRNNQHEFHFKHPAPFPEQLANDHIISWSNEGDLILDPFAGSGTTGRVAKKLNRNYILIEKVPQYVDIILNSFS